MAGNHVEEEPLGRTHYFLMVAGLVLLAALVPLWAPAHQVLAWRDVRRAKRFRERADSLRLVDLAVEGDELVIVDRKDRRTERVGISAIECADWWELDREGNFAAAGTPPEHIVELVLRGGETRALHTELGSWWPPGSLAWADALVARGVLPKKARAAGRKLAVFPHPFITAGFLLWWAVFIAVRHIVR